MSCGSGEGRKRSQMSVPGTSQYTLGGKDVDLTNMVGVIKTPGGATEPCLLKKLPDGKLGTPACTPPTSMHSDHRDDQRDASPTFYLGNWDAPLLFNYGRPIFALWFVSFFLSFFLLFFLA